MSQRSRFPPAVALLTVLLVLVPGAAWSAWSHDPTVNTAVPPFGGAS